MSWMAFKRESPLATSCWKYKFKEWVANLCVHTCDVRSHVCVWTYAFLRVRLRAKPIGRTVNDVVFEALAPGWLAQNLAFPDLSPHHWRSLLYPDLKADRTRTYVCVVHASVRAMCMRANLFFLLTWKNLAFAGSNLMATAKQLNTDRRRSRMEDKSSLTSFESEFWSECLKLKHWSRDKIMERSELKPPHFLKVALHRWLSRRQTTTALTKEVESCFLNFVSILSDFLSRHQKIWAILQLHKK